jgi:hypothetical protein
VGRHGPRAGLRGISADLETVSAALPDPQGEFPLQQAIDKDELLSCLSILTERERRDLAWYKNVPVAEGASASADSDRKPEARKRSALRAMEKMKEHFQSPDNQEYSY